MRLPTGILRRKSVPDKHLRDHEWDTGEIFPSGWCLGDSRGCAKTGAQAGARAV